MKTSDFLDKFGNPPSDPITNSVNKISEHCVSCIHFNKSYAKCLKSGTCVYNLTELMKLAKGVSK